jgi:uncharacterized protein (TIGR01244 family)
MTKIARLGILAALVAAALTGGWLDHAQAGARQAPFGDKVSAAILNYNRASPQIATSGKYSPAAVAEIKSLGFAAVLDLRSQGENGATEVAAAARDAGLNYLNIPVTTKAPTDEQVAAFAKIVEDPANHPLLVSCASANRAGAMWALYRAARGVDPKVAIEEGRAAGLEPNREQAVRERLGLPPLTD